MRFASEKELGNVEAIKKLSDESMKAFHSAMDDNMNTTLALTAFMKFVTEINRYAAQKAHSRYVKGSLKVFKNFMDVFGLKVFEATDREKEEIEELIATRNELRAEKKFRRL